MLGSDLRSIPVMTQAAQAPSCLLQCCPTFQGTMSVGTRFHNSHRAILLVAVIRIKMSFYQQGKKKKDLSGNLKQGNPYRALNCMCSRAHVHCTITSALGIAACIIRVFYASALITKINIQGSISNYI